MKKLLLMSALGLALLQNVFAQSQVNSNVLLANLQEMDYTGYSGSTISGITFTVSADLATSSNDYLQDFQASAFLIPCDASGNVSASATMSDAIIIQSWTISGLNQAASYTINNQSVDLSQVMGLQNGQYRLGFWADSQDDIPSPTDDPSDNAYFVTLNGNGDKAASIINIPSTTAVVSSLKDLGIAMPNPMTQDQLSSFINTNQFDAVKAYDFLGQEQNINSLNKGVYVLRLTKNNKMYTGKISIQ